MPVIKIVVLDLRAVRVVNADVVRAEVAVSDGVIVVVARPWLMDVLRRQGRRQRQKRHDKKQSSGPGRWTNHSVHY